MKQGLSNPALVTLLSTPQGQKALAKTGQATGRALDLGFTILKIGIFSLAGYIIYRKVTGAFSKVSEDSNYRPANVTIVSAKQRAENIFNAMYGVKNDFNKVSQNLSGLNHNGFIRVYNEFGSRRGADFKKLNLTEWLYDQFNATQIAQLKFITNNSF
ncbi:hypothetical protein [Flavobacterium sp.]|uniref:hypothetical protein n=1 Tax=Flavobacterium sp. TaxID=239 RepID=UPI00374CFE00